MKFCKKALDILQRDIQKSWMEQDEFYTKYGQAVGQIEDLKEHIGEYNKKIKQLEMTNSVLKAQIPANSLDLQIGSHLPSLGLNPIA